MPSVKPFNAQDFENELVNGDSSLDLDILDPVRTRSDFDITAPTIKVDSLIQSSIDHVNDSITNYKIETVASLEKKVKDLTEKDKNLTNKLKDQTTDLTNINAWLADARKRNDPNEKDNIQKKEAEARTLDHEIHKNQLQLADFKQYLEAAKKDLETAKAGGNILKIKSILERYEATPLRRPGAKSAFVAEKGYDIKSQLLQAGITGEIGKTTIRLRKSSIDNNIRLLLSNEPIYVYCLYRAFKDDNVKDTDGLFNRVMIYVEEIQDQVNELSATQFFVSSKLDPSQIDKDVFVGIIKTARFSYAEGRPVAFMKKQMGKMRKFGLLPKYVDDYFDYNEIPKYKGTPEIKQKMVEFLYNLDLQITGPILPKGEFDEYFANAYAFAAKLITSDVDPVKNVYSDVQVDSFDFKVDYFDTVEEQSIDRQNILGAAVLFYNKVLADDLGILRITDAIIMAWTQGKLDIPQGETATKLYRYYKLRKDRTTPEERAMFYKIVFNSGSAEVLENAAVNTEFSVLWSTLMNETVKYIEKFETKDNANEFVSKVGVFNAIKNLQYNLSVFMSGMVKSLLPEMYAQLQSAIDILKRSEIVQQLGQGYQRNMWKVIERVSADAFNYVPNVSALRTIAVKGHTIFSTIAQFDEAQFTEESFRIFISDVEEFIVANGQVEIRDTEDTEEKEPTKEEKDDWNF